MLSDKNQWVPTPKQSRFLQIPFTVLEGFYAGAVYAGKSDILLLYPILHKFHENPKFKGLFLRRTFPELKNEIIPRSQLYYKRVGAKYNKNDKVWEFPSGALIFFGHCENEDDVHHYDSMQINYAAFDELTSFTEWQYLYITLQRVRTVQGSDLPAIVRSASNPGNIGHNWVKKRFIDPEPTGNVILTNQAGIKRVYIPATINDNPYADPNYRKSLESLPQAEREAKLLGKWDAFEGQVFDEFRDKSYPDEPENALHVIPEFDIPSWWPKIVAIDWGFAPPAMTIALFGAISPNGRVYIYREQHWQKTRIEEWGAQIRPYVELDDPRSIKLCKSAGQDRGQEHTIQSQVSTAIGRPVDLTNNQSGSRVAGKMLLHEYLRWKQKFIPKKDIQPYNHLHATWLLRNRSPKEYQNYIDSFREKEPEDNLPKLQIFDTCPMLINAIKLCVYDKTNPQDVAEFPGDDPYDALRYLVDASERYVHESNVEFNKVQEKQYLLEELKKTGDMTAFYNTARRLEESNPQFGVRRYHGRR